MNKLNSMIVGISNKCEEKPSKLECIVSHTKMMKTSHTVLYKFVRFRIQIDISSEAESLGH